MQTQPETTRSIVNGRPCTSHGRISRRTNWAAKGTRCRFQTCDDVKCECAETNHTYQRTETRSITTNVQWTLDYELNCCLTTEPVRPTTCRQTIHTNGSRTTANRTKFEYEDSECQTPYGHRFLRTFTFKTYGTQPKHGDD